jgi:hypothetical protein
MEPTVKDFDQAVDKLVDSIIKAAHKIKESDRAEAYIREKVAIIYTAGKHVGQQVLTDEIFNQSH